MMINCESDWMTCPMRKFKIKWWRWLLWNVLKIEQLTNCQRTCKYSLSSLSSFNNPPTFFYLGLWRFTFHSFHLLFSFSSSKFSVFIRFRSIKELISPASAFIFIRRCLSVKSSALFTSQERKKPKFNNNLVGKLVQLRNFANLSALNQKSAEMKPEFERLPKSVTPSHYDLKLQPDLVNFTFTGSSKTSIKVSRTSRQWICIFCVCASRKFRILVKNNKTRNKKIQFVMCVRCSDVIAIKKQWKKKFMNF